ncbi:hypothetical protein GI374_15850 [Paracoccus sp. S-4012]|uniref:hypothetical protein n=1 Tax=Paracoccus sp. S-4012 TaxID=2665648 RepID=UPI0012B046D9|nr:hypothetical protein [Paracoccus sp. S-4012]MRX51866.1 hypothetical protein [Paracoccus sp. S-4012]
MRLNGELAELPVPIFEAEVDRLSGIEAAIMHTPSANATDLQMKIATFTAWGDFEIANCAHSSADIIWNELRTLTGVRA